MRYILFAAVIVILSSCGNTYYIVRHAEKAVPGAGMSSDVPLSPEGEQRAAELRQLLKDENVLYIFSTNYKRTISTAKPLSELRGNTKIELYNSSKDSLAAFTNRLKSIKKGNVLIVGHSNTIDDVANALCGFTVVPGDLKDNQYDNLFVVKRKGKKYSFTNKKYGVRTE